MDPGRKGREKLFLIDWDEIHKGNALWQPEWHAVHTAPSKLLHSKTVVHPGKASLVRRFEIEGAEWLELTITLSEDSPNIELTVELQKTDIRTAESYTMPLSLNLPADWQGHYDTAGVITELDAEQLDGTSKEFLTVDRIATMHHGGKGVTLVCPDAPLVYLGGNGFGRKTKSIPRDANPTLSAWPLNNYWDTNFSASQPGRLSFRYHLITHAEPDFDHLIATANALTTPVYEFDVCKLPAEQSGTLLKLSDPDVATTIHPINNGREALVILISQQDKKDLALAPSGSGHQISPPIQPDWRRAQ